MGNKPVAARAMEDKKKPLVSTTKREMSCLSGQDTGAATPAREPSAGECSWGYFGGFQQEQTVVHLIIVYLVEL